MEEETLDLKEYLNMFLARWWMLVLGPVVAVAAVLGLAQMNKADTAAAPIVYRATTNVLVGKSIGLAEMPELAVSPLVLGRAAEEIELALRIEPLQVEALRGMVTAEKVNSHIVNIAVQHSDPELAEALANGVAQHYESHLRSLREAHIGSLQENLPRDPENSNSVLNSQVASEALANLSFMSSAIAVLAPAEVAEVAIGSSGVFGNVTRNVTLAAALGVVIAGAMVLLLEFWQRPVRSEAQMESRFGLDTLGSLGRWKSGGSSENVSVPELLSDDNTDRELQRLAASLELAARNSNSKVLALVSGRDGTGRSSLVAGLGVAVSEQWREVVLVDADLHNPTLHKLFNLDNSVGLGNLLSNPTLELNEVIQKTKYPRLQIITAGSLPAGATGLLKCPRTQWVLDRLRERSDITLVDTPAAMASADTMLLAQQVDGLVVVADATKTSQGDMEAALNDLQRANKNILGFIWNRKHVGILNTWNRKSSVPVSKGSLAPNFAETPGQSLASSPIERNEPVPANV